MLSLNCPKSVVHTLAVYLHRRQTVTPYRDFISTLFWRQYVTPPYSAGFILFQRDLCLIKIFISLYGSCKVSIVVKSIIKINGMKEKSGAYKNVYSNCYTYLNYLLLIS